MGYSRLVVVLTGTYAHIFTKVMTCATLLIQEDAVESVGVHLVAIYKHYMGNVFWDSVSNAGLRNACHKYFCPVAIKVFWNGISNAGLRNACHKYFCPVANLGGALCEW